MSKRWKQLEVFFIKYCTTKKLLVEIFTLQANILDAMQEF